MTATDAQVRILMRERKKGRTQEQAAAKANLNSRNTAAKHEQLGLLPSQMKRPRTYVIRDPKNLNEYFNEYYEEGLLLRMAGTFFFIVENLEQFRKFVVDNNGEAEDIDSKYLKTKNPGFPELDYSWLIISCY